MASAKVLYDGIPYKLVDRGRSFYQLKGNVLKPFSPGSEKNGEIISGDLVEVRQRMGFSHVPVGYVLLTEKKLEGASLGGLPVASLNSKLEEPELPEISDPFDAYRAVPGLHYAAVAGSAYAFLPEPVGLGNPLLALLGYLGLPLLYAAYSGVKSSLAYLNSYKNRWSQLKENAAPIVAALIGSGGES